MAASAQEWYRQPVLWFAIVSLAASLLVVVLTIVVAAQHTDPALATGNELRILDMPPSHEPARAAPR